MLNGGPNLPGPCFPIHRRAVRHMLGTLPIESTCDRWSVRGVRRVRRRGRRLLAHRCVTGAPIAASPASPGTPSCPNRRHQRTCQAQTGASTASSSVSGGPLRGSSSSSRRPTVADPDDGYHFAVLGSHYADVDALVGALTRRATDGIAEQQLEPHPHRAGWLLRDDDVAGRLVWGGEREHGGPYDVVVDGRRLTWDELGHALEPYEGWRFRLVLEDPCDDLRRTQT
jgi:hypothetical protein